MAAPLFKRLESAGGRVCRLRDVLDALQFTDDGLIPAIAQHHDTGEVVMVGYMNRATLEETLTTGRVCYYSRSRKRVWRKGEESGNIQMLRELRIDCDGDALLLIVEQTRTRLPHRPTPLLLPEGRRRSRHGDRHAGTQPRTDVPLGGVNL